MTILLLRPDSRLKQSLSTFRRRGIDAIGFAPVTLEPLYPTELQQQLAELYRSQPSPVGVVFFSPAAVEFFFLQTELLNTILNRLTLDSPYLCVGSSTAQLLAEKLKQLSLGEIHGASTPIKYQSGRIFTPSSENSEGLWQLIQDLKPIAGLILLRGKNGRPWINQQLDMNQVKYIELALYERKKNAQSFSFSTALGNLDTFQPALGYNASELGQQLVGRGISAVSVKSVDVAAAFLSDGKNAWSKQLPWFTVNERVAIALRQFGCEQVILTNDPSDEVLLDVIEAHRASAQGEG